jgi:hypothetical protein
MIAVIIPIRGHRKKIGTAMNKRAIMLSSILLLATTVFAREKTDVIVMKNGDRMTGEVKGLDSGVLSLSLDYVDGTISLQWSKVARMESGQKFIVQTEDGSVHSGTLNTVETPTNEPLKIQIAQTPEATVAIEASRIVKIGETSEKFLQRFNGAVDFGIDYSKGNQTSVYSFGAQTQYLRERWAAQAAFDSNLSSNSGSPTTTRNQLALSGYHLLRWDNYFYSGNNSFLQSSVQGISLQTTLGGGIGRFLKNTNRTTISILAGLAWQRTDYEQSVLTPGTQNAGAALIALRLRVFKFKKANLTTTADLLPTLTEPGRVRFDTNTSFNLKLFSNFWWNASFYGNWDNRPPPTLSGSDYGSSSGLSWTFGNR